MLRDVEPYFLRKKYSIFFVPHSISHPINEALEKFISRVFSEYVWRREEKKTTSKSKKSKLKGKKYKKKIHINTMGTMYVRNLRTYVREE